jgi:ATP-binding cassette subfamily B protein
MSVDRGYPAFLRVAWAAGPGLLIGNLSMVFVGALAPAAGVAAAGAAIAQVPRMIATGDGTAAGRTAMLWAIAAGACFVVQRAAAAGTIAAATVLGARIDALLQRDLMDAVMRPVGVGHLEDPETLDLLNVGRETFRSGWGRPGRLAATASGLVAGRVSLVGACLVVGRFQPVLGGALLVAGLWAAYEDKVASRDEAAHHYGSTEGSRRTEYLYDLGITPPPAKEVRVFGLSGFLLDRYLASWRSTMTDVFRRSNPRPVVATAVLALVALTGVGLFGVQALDGGIGPGGAAACVQAIMVALLAVQQSSWTGLQSELALATLERYREAVAAVDAAGTAQDAGDRAADDLPRNLIRFEGVSFRYPGATGNALTDLDLSIPAGRSLAVVGVNGAGKSTLIKLLTKLYRPTSGRITVDGIDLTTIDAAQWRHRTAAVYQESTRFPFAARTNVEYGRIDAPGDLDSLDRAAEMAGAAEAIERLPQRWDTPLSSEYSGGVDLSGGEWQKIAMARAFYAVEHGAGVLILDEPAAHLDARSEADLYARFLTITEGLTTIVISHRFSTVRQASSIVVLDEGGIVEQGTHDDLMARHGRYADMFELQASRFAPKAEPGAGA